MKTTVTILVFAWLVLLAALTVYQSSVIDRQKALIIQMTHNPACMYDSPNSK